MKYMLQELSGERCQITPEMASVAQQVMDAEGKPMYRRVLATGSVEIYARIGAKKPREEVYHYGGRMNPRHGEGYRGG